MAGDTSGEELHLFVKQKHYLIQGEFRCVSLSKAFSLTSLFMPCFFFFPRDLTAFLPPHKPYLACTEGSVAPHFTHTSN